jgi:hypothetical protein
MALHEGMAPFIEKRTLGDLDWMWGKETELKPGVMVQICDPQHKGS